MIERQEIMERAREFRLAPNVVEKDYATALQGLALFPDLCLPLIGAAFSEGCHCHTPLVRERV